MFGIEGGMKILADSIMCCDPIIGGFTKISKRLIEPGNIPPKKDAELNRDAIRAARGDKTRGLGPVDYRNKLTSKNFGLVKRAKKTPRAG